jgi:succinoglycan biosynthesis transport protein ExoP
MNDLGRPGAALLPAKPSQSNLIDLRKIFGVLRRRLWWMVATFVLVIVLTGVAYKLVTPKYMATATVALDRRVDELVTSGPANPNSALTTDSPSVDTEVQVLTSPRLAAAVVDQMKLQTVLGYGQPKTGPKKNTPVEAEAAAISALQSKLVVKRQGLSYAINVSLTDADPVLATSIVNAVIDQYVSEGRGDKATERNSDSTLLAQRLATLRTDVVNAEAAVASYRARTNLIDVSKDSTSTQQEMSFLSTQLAQAKADQAAANAKVAAAQSASTAAASGLESEVLRGLRAQEAELSAQRADLAGRYGELHPALAKVDRQLKDVRGNIDAELTRIRAGTVNDQHVADGRVASIQGSLNKAQGALGAANSASVQLNELERNADSARVLYQSLLDRYNQSVTGQGTERSNAYVVARATQPVLPTSPDKILFGLGGGIAGIIAAAAVVLLLELLETGFQTRAEVETALGLPVLASVPDLRTIKGTRINVRDPMAPADYLVGHEGSLFGESFRAMRGALSASTRAGQLKTLAVTSSLPGEGKTTVAICLARSAALAGLKTVLIDCDLRRRTSSRAMSDDVTAGLVEVLKGTVPLRDALIRDEKSGAWLLAQKKTDDLDYEIVASKRMQDLVAALSESFDMVILDTSPILALAEARAVSAMADNVIFVARWRKTPSQAAQMALDQLGRAGAHVAGVVLSQVNLKLQAKAVSGDEMVYYNVFKSYYTT